MLYGTSTRFSLSALPGIPTQLTSISQPPKAMLKEHPLTYTLLDLCEYFPTACTQSAIPGYRVYIT